MLQYHQMRTSFTIYTRVYPLISSTTTYHLHYMRTPFTPFTLGVHPSPNHHVPTSPNAYTFYTIYTGDTPPSILPLPLSSYVHDLHHLHYLHQGNTPPSQHNTKITKCVHHLHHLHHLHWGYPFTITIYVNQLHYLQQGNTPPSQPHQHHMRTLYTPDKSIALQHHMCTPFTLFTLGDTIPSRLPCPHTYTIYTIYTRVTGQAPGTSNIICVH